MTCFYDVPKVDTTTGSSTDYKPLPSTVTDFIAEIVCGILETHQPPGFTWDFIPLPELLLFIEKVTAKAKVDVQTAIASMVLVSRLKKRLPKAAHGEYGTYHKIFLASLLVALKEFTPVTKEEEKETTETSSETNNANDTNDTNNTDDINNASEENNNNNNTNDTNNDDNSDNNDTNSNLSQSPTNSIISTTATSIHSDDDQDDDILFRNNPNPNQPNGFDYKLKRPVINRKLSDISGIYNPQDLERMEREFVYRLGGNDKVTDKDIREYVENNRHALGIC